MPGWGLAQVKLFSAARLGLASVETATREKYCQRQAPRRASLTAAGLAAAAKGVTRFVSLLFGDDYYFYALSFFPHKPAINGAALALRALLHWPFAGHLLFPCFPGLSLIDTRWLGARHFLFKDPALRRARCAAPLC